MITIRTIREVERKEKEKEKEKEDLWVELEEAREDKEMLKVSLMALEEKRRFWQEQAQYFNEELRKCDMDKKEIAALKDEVARLRRCLQERGAK